MASGSTTPITFMATSRSGLGHLRRVASIAAALKKAESNLAIELLTNAPLAGLTAEDLACFDHKAVHDRSAMAGHARARDAGIVVADTMVPEGIERLRSSCVLVLRETPTDRLERFRLAGGRAWDLLLIPNPSAHWLPTLDVGFARRVEAVGWIYRRPQGAPDPDRAMPTVLVATGGGGTDQTAAMLARRAEAVIARARQGSSRPFRVIQALGPRAPEGALVARADSIVDPGGDLHELFATADLVISTAGYNSVLELALTTTPTMLMAIDRTYDDQAGRAASWGPLLGMAYREEQTDEAARWLISTLEHRARRPAVDIGPSGAENAARRILELRG